MDLNAAQQRLNTEHCEVLEHHKVVIESRVVAFNNSSGTSCRSIASQCSKKKSPIEIRISGIEDRTK